MRIKATQLLRVEDFPDQKGWIGKLVGPINDFILQSIKILNNGISFEDNLAGIDHTFTFTYQSDATSYPLKLRWTGSVRPRALNVISATEDGTSIIANVAWRYTQEGFVELTSIVKFTSAPAVALLTANSDYEIRCRITG